MPKKKAKLPLSKTHPKLAKEADGWDPKKYTYGSHAMLPWKCKNGHQWVARLSSRAGKTNNGCGFCSGKKLIVGVNDLATTNPKIASEADGWDPKKVSGRNGKKFKWKCAAGHNWETTVASRTSKTPTGCPVCKRRKIVTGKNDLLSSHPAIAKQAYNWDPSTVFSGSGQIKEWICTANHVYKSSVDGRTGKRKRGCPICSGQKLEIGMNDLATTHPKVSIEAHLWDPSKFHGGSAKKQFWKCSSGHIYESRIVNRTRINSGCHFCSNLKVLQGFNDLETTHPHLAIQADGWNPKKVIAGSHKKVKWECPKGHKWQTMLGSRTGKIETGCPSCAISGFRPDQIAYLYFLNHSIWQMHQIGITNFPEDRLTKHKNLGWEVLEIRGPMDGHLTQQWEAAILRMLKAKGADLSNSKVAGKFDGYSEAWSKSTFPVKTIKELMQLTEEFESYKK